MGKLFAFIVAGLVLGLLCWCSFTLGYYCGGGTGFGTKEFVLISSGFGLSCLTGYLVGRKGTKPADAEPFATKGQE